MGGRQKSGVGEAEVGGRQKSGVGCPRRRLGTDSGVASPKYHRHFSINLGGFSDQIPIFLYHSSLLTCLLVSHIFIIYVTLLLLMSHCFLLMSHCFSYSCHIVYSCHFFFYSCHAVFWRTEKYEQKNTQLNVFTMFCEENGVDKNVNLGVEKM